MTPIELLLILAWVLLPALIMGSVVLACYRAMNNEPSLLRTVQACMRMTVLSSCLSLLFVVFGPAWLGPQLGLRDDPVMWAAFAFIAVFLALPPSIGLMRLTVTPRSEKQR